jgi:NAD(P)-dependent dehydrogenase (short-subunit alcohol dehydrogenase family)
MDLATAKHAFITGGASGIGLGIADALAARGIAVTIADVDPESLRAVLSSRTGRWRGENLDVRDRAAWAAARQSAEAAFGPVDILVNNAGIAPNGREFADMPPESFDRILGINLVGVFNGVSAFAADLRARRHGHIVNTASMAGLASSHPGVGAYTAAKFGVVGLTETLRNEMSPHGVGVSLLCPGLVKTNLPQSTLKIGGELRPGSGAMADSGVSTGRVAELVIDGISRNLLYIITHPQQWSGIQKRFDGLREAFQP